MPYIAIKGSNQDNNWKPKTGTIITNTKTTEVFLLTCKVNEKPADLIIVNLKTGYWDYWKGENYSDFQPLDPQYEVIMSNGEIEE